MRENRLGELAGGDLLAQLEGVEVGDEDLRLAKLFLSCGRDDVALAVVVLRVVGQQHAQPVADGDAGRDDEERVGEAGVLRVGELVERLPGDEHGHDDGLARAGRHLECSAGQARVRGVVRFAERVLNPGVAEFFGNLGDIDGGFEGLDLAEEELLLAARIGPVVEQSAVVGVTPTYPPFRQRTTRRRIRLTSLFSSMRSCVHSVSN